MEKRGHKRAWRSGRVLRSKVDTADFGTGFRGASGEQQEWKKEECIPDAASRLDIGWQFYRAIRDD